MDKDKAIDFQHVNWNSSDLEAMKEVVVKKNETLIPERWYKVLPIEQQGLWKIKISIENGKIERLYKWVGGDDKPWIIGVTL